MSAFRSRCRYSPLIGQVRAGGILLQGVWFWHVGAILRSPDRWAEQEHDNIMHLSIAFVWDAFVIIFIYIPITALVGWLSRGRYGESADVKQAGKLSLQDARTYQPLQNSAETSLTPKATESI
ncbi:unnamed protein product [Dibothriocephalus latus]|uniref:Uncharacterized protein n=1 Tax=Dibothriocephalus latus TaxID=60516 RepID=A0A3P6R8Q6_DIBLA|nr:unnamed protein product [Dibothriocephalus latus]